LRPYYPTTVNYLVK